MNQSWKAALVALTFVLQACHASQPTRSQTLQARLDAARHSFEQSDGDFEDWVRQLGHDPADLYERCYLGDVAALHDLFMISQTGTDGAVSEGYAAWLSEMLYAVGDVRFGNQLTKESVRVQDQVRGYLCFELGIPDHEMPWEIQARYPVTFPTGTLVFEVSSRVWGKDDRWDEPYYRGVVDHVHARAVGQPSDAAIVEVEGVRVPTDRGVVYAIRYDWERGWWGDWAVLGMDDSRVTWQAEIVFDRLVEIDRAEYVPQAQSIYSVRALLLEGQSNPIVEVIDITHMGHGRIFLYILDSEKLYPVLASNVLDRHVDRTLIQDGGVLKREYKDLNADGFTDVRLSGKGTVYPDDDDKASQTIELEKVYYWSPRDNHFVTDQTKWKWFERDAR